MTTAAEIIAAFLVGKSLCISAENWKIYIKSFANLRFNFCDFFKAVFHQIRVLFIVAETRLNRVRSEHHQITDISFVLLFVPRLICIVHVRIAELMTSYGHIRWIFSAYIFRQCKLTVNHPAFSEKDRVAVNQASQTMCRNRNFFFFMFNRKIFAFALVNELQFNVTVACFFVENERLFTCSDFNFFREKLGGEFCFLPVGNYFYVFEHKNHFITALIIFSI